MKKRLMAGLYGLFAFWLATVPASRAADPSDAEKNIAELYNSGKLFDKAQYKTVRAAYAQLFEETHQKQIQNAFGADFDKFAEWLKAHPELKEEFYTALDDKTDKLEPALVLFKNLWKEFPERIEPYANAAIAVAVVWDDERQGVYDYSREVARTHSKMPEKLVGALDNFRYLTEDEKIFEGRARHLPWEFLIYVVDHGTPIGERKWAQDYFKSANGRVKSFHQDVPYDNDLLKGEHMKDSKSKPHLEGMEYTLKNLKMHGGVCAEQADFAARVGKSVCLPSAYCFGASTYRGLHAWCLYANVKQAANDKIAFALVSDGRFIGFQKDAFYTGFVTDPKTGQQILDRDMERRLWVVGNDRVGKRQADLAMRAYPALCKQLDLDVKARVDYIDRCLKVSPYNEAAWIAFAKMSKAGDLGAAQKQVVLTHLTSINKTFADYPDFIWQVFDDLITVQPDKKERVNLYQTVVTLFEKHGRPDLACDARLKIAELWAEQEQWQTAGQGLIQTIRKFPTEGRYVPKMTEKLQDISKHYKGGTDALAKLYIELVPAMFLYYQDDKNLHCNWMHEQAMKFLTENKLEKPAAELKVKTEAARALMRAK
jgi:hypothetical protein